MATALRFHFPREFTDGPAQAPDAAALGAEIARLSAERDAAFEAGRQVGLEQARAEQGEALLAAADALGAGLEALDEELGALRDATARDGAALALAAAEFLAGAVPPSVAVNAAIGRALEMTPRGTALTARVAPELAPEIERLIAERQANDRRRLRVTVIADPTLGGGDARIGWEGGGVELDRAARDAALCEELADLLGPEPD